MRLVLASKSPRRQQLLSQFGLDFDVVAADIDEQAEPGETPESLAIRLATEKSTVVYQQLGQGYRVLGGDTVVSIDGVILGKPKDKSDALTMLELLSGCTHSVFSAVALTDHTGCRSLLSESRVSFAELDDSDVLEYCDSDDPYDKAGAYGIQGKAGGFVTHLDGSYSGVMGLPLWQVHQLLMNSE